MALDITRNISLLQTSNTTPSYVVIFHLEGDCGVKLNNPKSFYAFEFLQVVTTTVLKLAILSLYRRTFATKAFKRAVTVVTTIILADSVGLFFALCFYCIPAAHFWDPTVPGKCINQVIFTTCASSSLMLTDVVLYLMPMPVIWKLQMTTRRKLELTIIFMLGGLYVVPNFCDLPTLNTYPKADSDSVFASLVLSRSLRVLGSISTT